MEQKNDAGIPKQQRIPPELGIREIFGDRILIKAEKVTEKLSKGGIILPESREDPPRFGEVVAIGEGDENSPIKVKPGDRVAFGKYEGSEFELNGEDYLICRQLGIIMVMETPKSNSNDHSKNPHNS